MDRASQFEFLDVSDWLLSRLGMFCTQVPAELVPKQSSIIVCDARAAFAGALKDYFGDYDMFRGAAGSSANVEPASPMIITHSAFSFDKNGSGGGSNGSGSGNGAPRGISAVFHSHSRNRSSGSVRRLSSTSSITLPFQDAQTQTTTWSGGGSPEEQFLFSRHCENHGRSMEKLHSTLDSLKNNVEDMHRDITSRKCAVRSRVLKAVAAETKVLR